MFETWWIAAKYWSLFETASFLLGDSLVAVVRVLEKERMSGRVWVWVLVLGLGVFVLQRRRKCWVSLSFED